MRSCMFSLFAVVATWILASEPSDQPRSLDRIEIIGNASFTTEAIQKGLRHVPRVVAALEPCVSKSEFQSIVAEAVETGYRGQGFSQCHVSFSDTGNGTLRLAIEEGPQQLKRSVTIHADPDVQAFLQEQWEQYLQDQGDKAIWKGGSPWNGQEQFSQEEQKSVANWLIQIGYLPTAVQPKIRIVDDGPETGVALDLFFQPDVKRPTVHSIESNLTDDKAVSEILTASGLGPGAAFLATTPRDAELALLRSARYQQVAVVADPGKGIGEVALRVTVTSVNATPSAEQATEVPIDRLIQMWEKTFGPSAGEQCLHLNVKTTAYDVNATFAVDGDSVHVSHRGEPLLHCVHLKDSDRLVVEANRELRFSVDIPNPSLMMNCSFDPTQSNPFHGNWNVSFNTDRKLAPVSRMNVTLQALLAFSTSGSPRISTKDGITTIQRSPNAMVAINEKNELVSLTYNDGPAQIALETIEKLDVPSSELGNRPDILPLFRMPPPVTGEKTSDRFYIFPGSSPAQITAAAGLHLMESLELFPRDSFMHGMLECYAIAVSEREDAFRSRMERLASEHAMGPLSQTALAWIASQGGFQEISQESIEMARRSLAKPEDFQADLDALMVQGGCFDKAFGNLDPQAAHRFAVRLGRVMELHPTTLALIRWSHPDHKPGVDGWRVVAEKLWPVLGVPRLQDQLDAASGKTRVANRP